MNRWATLAVGLVSAAILVVGWFMNDDRWREGPVELSLSPDRGLHRMDVLVLVLAGLPWIGILATAIWPKRRR
jgi:hypothetical protein